jgi:hypothetical protein
MTTTAEQVLSVYKQSIVAFMDELIDQFPKETGLILARIFLKDQIPIEVTMKNFIFKLDKNNGHLKKMVAEKNEQFFIDNDIFSIESGGDSYSLSGGTVNHFRKLWLSDLDKDDQETMWKWFESFVVLADKYKTITQPT